jgi:hypothetical protein
MRGYINFFETSLGLGGQMVFTYWLSGSLRMGKETWFHRSLPVGNMFSPPDAVIQLNQAVCGNTMVCYGPTGC